MAKKKKDKESIELTEIKGYNRLCVELALAAPSIPRLKRELIDSFCPAPQNIFAWILLESTFGSVRELMETHGGDCKDPNCLQNQKDAAAGAMQGLDAAIERLTKHRIEISRFHDKLKV
jgi:hypothetical protein